MKRAVDAGPHDRGGLRLRGVVGDHPTGRLCRRTWEGPRDEALAAAAAMARDLRHEATAHGFFPA